MVSISLIHIILITKNAMITHGHSMTPITFCINTSNNEREYVALLFESLLNGVDVSLHDFLVFVDSDNQNTTDMLMSLKPSFPNLSIIKNTDEPVGYAGNINYLFQKAKTDVVSYLQSDMIVSLGYDKALLAHIRENRIICSTRVEPPLHCPEDNAVTYVRDFGLDPSSFQYEPFLKFAEANKDPQKLTDYFFAPFTCYKKNWLEHDVSFKKSREDSDIALRFALKGYEMKQTWGALVYHFTCTSSRGIEWYKPENQQRDKQRMELDGIELKRFINKWGTFIHPRSPHEVEHLKTPAMLDKIIVCNPPIDESKLIVI